MVVPVYNEPRIERTLAGLYGQTHRDGVHHYLVDNGSTDDTRARIDAFQAAHADFPLTVLEEAQKGTGAASDTGFRQAAADGFRVVARTDGDSVPSPAWTGRIVLGFAAEPAVQLLGGASKALEDQYHRRGDGVLLSVAVRGARVALSLQHRDGDYRHAVIGHNMATRSIAYEQVGGFERTAIDARDEDVDYSLKIAKQFGRAAIQTDSAMHVATSMRRVREYGIRGTALHHLFPGRRIRSSKEIDVR
ncbi:MAG: hypothetical protein JWM89_3388 [Acidimicrobiales bacterium]|nr:hypothetical protein [Acidimicrobiales bacterium]